MNAVWNGTPQGIGTLDLGPDGGRSTKSISHLGGSSQKRGITAISPTLSTNIVWEFDFFDDGAGNKRVSGGLRNTSSSVILEMGRFNAVANPPGANISGYGLRVVNAGESQTPGGPDNVDWITFAPNLAATAGWHHMRAIISVGSILFQLDKGDDGSIDASRTIFTATGGAEIYNQVRFGGPSDVTSAGGGLNFDNLRIETVAVPEAGSFVAMGFVGLLSAGAVWIRKRRVGQAAA
jgi:hypothetical protein